MWKFLERYAEETLGAVLLAVMACIAFVNVGVRYLSNLSFAWSEELTVNLFVWVVLLGASCCFRDGGHLGMNILYDALPRKLRLVCHVLGVVLGVAFFGALVWYGCLELRDEIDLESTSESLGIPVWWYTLITPVASVLIIARLVQRACADLRAGTL